jgi:putative hydrolase of the HAD superfamily
MKKNIPITTLFLDVGGVLLTNGWDHHARKRAAKHFKLDWAEMEERHELNFEIYEEDKLTLPGIFGPGGLLQKRPFTRAEFRQFMFAQSKPFTEMIELVRNLKARYGLKIIVVSNEARELNAYRIRKFKLDGFVDAFVSSCFVHLRKPDADIFRLALGHRPGASPANCLYRKHPDVRSDRGRFGDSRHSAHGLQIHCAKLASLGLQPDEGVIHETQ